MKGPAAVLSAAAALVAFSGPGPVATAAKVPVGNYVYVHNRAADGMVYGFSLAADGTLTALPGSPFDTGADGGGCGGYCETMTYSAKRKLLFVGGEAGGIGVLRVLPGGGLEEVAGSPFGPEGIGIWGVGVVQKGKRTFVYGSDYQNDQVRGFEVLADDTLVELESSPFAAGDGPDGLAAVKNKVFAANENATSVSAWTVANDGSLVSAGDPFPVDGVDFIYNVNPDPAGKVLYVGGCDDTLAVFSVNPKTGALTSLEDAPYATTISDVCSGVAVTKKLVLVPSNNDGLLANLQAYRRGKGGSLTALGELQDTGLNGATVCGTDAKGKVMVIAQGETIGALLLDAKTGAVTAGTPLAHGISGRINCLVVVRR